MIKFNQYLSNTIFDLGNEEYQKLCDALDIVYNGDLGNIHKSAKLVDTLYWEYNSDDSLETNWDVRDKVIDGFKQSKNYQDWLSDVEKIITDRFEVKKDVATRMLVGKMLSDKVNRRDEEFDSEFLGKMKYYNQLENEIAELNNLLND
jgi:hypothetical protein